MPLSLNEIKDRALAFSREWEGARAERAEAQTFWNEFFAVFGISRRRVATFEEPVKTLPLFDKQPVKTGRIDLFWRGTTPPTLPLPQGEETGDENVPRERFRLRGKDEYLWAGLEWRNVSQDRVK